MSSDIQLAFPCPHIIRERLQLQPDRLTLVPSVPIGGSGLLSVRANDAEIPGPHGIETPATIHTAIREPYHITHTTRVLTVTVGGTSRDITLTAGNRSASHVATELGAGFGAGLGIRVDSGITLYDALAVGPASTIAVRGTAAETLGFNPYRATGIVTHPGWNLYADPGGVGFYLKFNRVVRSSVVYVVSYTTPRSFCPRCNGSEVENDFRTDDVGNIRTITDSNLLYQGVMKIILTELGSNIDHPWYGSGLKRSIGTKATGNVEDLLKSTVTTALANFKNLQTAQARYQSLSADERLYSVDYIYVTQSPVDRTLYKIDVGVRSFATTPVSISIVYATSGTYALPGTNNLSLGTG